MATEEAEAALRARLGIPTSAQRVLILQESSHWDTNWLRTSQEYFHSRIEPIFEAILRELEHEPARVFAVESLYFLQLYWQRHPELQPRLHDLLRTRRLRLLASSLTTPDTLLPHPEAVLRDFLLGQEWLRAIGIDEFPRTAYFPDNFGHSPCLPSLMQAAGVHGVGITRIDGMHFVGSDWRPRGRFPLPGSTAHLLQREHRTLDFVWRDGSGAQVLCHWNAFTYFQGDMLGHLGVIRWNGTLFGVRWRSAAHVRRQLDGFVRALAPLSVSPYLFCPIGCDFNPPIEGLGALVERYNREESGRSGTHVVIAGLDDYLALVDCHRARLPVLEVDPNPAWMGFYASRPELKALHTRTARRLLEREREAARSGASTPELEAAWNLVALSNHHDFITGTSPDRVVQAEQAPWLNQASALCGRSNPSAVTRGHAPRWSRSGDVLRVEADDYRLELCERRGGCLVAAHDSSQGEWMAGLGLDLVLYRDTGGLWRLGHEFAGGSFKVLDRASRREAHVSVQTEGDWLAVRTRLLLGGQPFVRTVLCPPRAEDGLRVLIQGLPPPRTTVTCALSGTQPLVGLSMDVVGGRVERPLAKLYSPTFWPALRQVQAGRLSLELDSPTGVSATAAGGLEWIVGRHGTKERAFGVLPVLAHPIGGSVDRPQAHEVRVRWTSAAPEQHPWIECSDPRVKVVAVKRAQDADGLIVRLQADEPPDQPVHLGLIGERLKAAAMCDARERNLAPLELDSGRARLPWPGRIATVRLWPERLA